jgi:hypothetical protein
LQDGREIGQVARGMPNGKDGGHDSILLDQTQHPPRRHGDTEKRLIGKNQRPLVHITAVAGHRRSA